MNGWLTANYRWRQTAVEVMTKCFLPSSTKLHRKWQSVNMTERLTKRVRTDGIQLWIFRFLGVTRKKNNELLSSGRLWMAEWFYKRRKSLISWENILRAADIRTGMLGSSPLYCLSSEYTGIYATRTSKFWPHDGLIFRQFKPGIKVKIVRNSAVTSFTLHKIASLITLPSQYIFYAGG